MSDQEAGSCIVDNESAMTSEMKAMGTNEETKEPSKEEKNGFVSRLQEYEAMFDKRYSTDDAAYMERVGSDLQPMIIHPFGGRDQQQWQNRRDDGRQFGGDRGRGGSFRRGNYNNRGGRWEQRR